MEVQTIAGWKMEEENTSSQHWKLLLRSFKFTITGILTKKVAHEKYPPQQNCKFCGKTKFGYFGPSEKGEVLVWLSWGPWDHYSDLPPPQPPAATRPTAQRLYKAHFIFSCLITASVVNTSDKDFALGPTAGLKKLMIMMKSLLLGDFELSKEKSNY